MSAPMPAFLAAQTIHRSVSFPKTRRYSLSDALHSIPELVVEVLSPDATLDIGEILGSETIFQIEDEPVVPQFDGIVRRVEERAADESGASVYVLTVVPRLWLTSERSGHRIFQKRTALEIAADVVEPYGPGMDSPAGLILGGVLPVHEYRVQCGETDRDFLFRILAEEGLVSCWIPDQNGKRTWVVTDDTSIGSVEMVVPYRPPSDALKATGPHVSAVRVEGRLRPSEVRLRDYSPRNPALLLDSREISGDAAESEWPLSRYGFAAGRFDDEAAGARQARMRLEQARSGSRTFRWEASFAMRAGMKIRLQDHPREDANGDFLVVSAWSEVQGQQRLHVAQVVPAATRWRPEIPPKPRIHGTQTAFVVGQPGKEIDVDPEGRVEVEFRWDTRDLHRAGASRRVRVAMPWMGRDRGFWTLPRVGDEVVIGYLDGDPDEPLVLGSVNNGAASPVAKLPDHATQSWWKSKSTPNGTGYNAILMEDQTGQELLALRAERDFLCDTTRNSRTNVGGSAALSVVQGQSVEVGGDSKTAVKGTYELHAGQVEIHSKGDINLNANGARNDSAETFHFISSPNIYVNGKELVEITAPIIVLEAGGSRIQLSEGGIRITSSSAVDVNGSIVKLNC